MQYIHKRQENLLHLSKVVPNKLWRQILTRKTKDNNRITLHDWNSYLKKIYESSNVIDNFETLLTTVEFFSLEDIDFGVKRLKNGKAKDIEGYKVEILKLEVMSSSLTSISYSIKRSSKGSLYHGHEASSSLFLKVGIQITPLIIGQL